jgi:hypothetical protein
VGFDVDPDRLELRHCFPHGRKCRTKVNFRNKKKLAPDHRRIKTGGIDGQLSEFCCHEMWRKSFGPHGLS